MECNGLDSPEGKVTFQRNKRQLSWKNHHMTFLVWGHDKRLGSKSCKDQVKEKCMVSLQDRRLTECGNI